MSLSDILPSIKCDNDIKDFSEDSIISHLPEREDYSSDIKEFKEEFLLDPFKEPDGCSSDSSGEKEEEKPFNKVCKHPNCGLRFKKNDLLERHVYHEHTQFKRFFCTREGCKKRYIILSHLKRHIKTFHEKKHEGHVDRFKCTVPGCERLFNTKTNVDRHVLTYHDQNLIYECSVCDFTGRHKLQFVRHMNNHFPDGDSKHKGKPLGKPIKEDPDQKDAEKDPDKKPAKKVVVMKKYDCERCGMTFTRWSDLMKHLQMIHYKCELCGSTFKRSKYFKAHMNDHKEKAQNQPLRCPHEGCTRTYSYQRNLNVHIRTAHLDLRYICPFENCRRAMTSKRRLNSHVELHYKDDLLVERRPQSDRKDKGVIKVPNIAMLAGVKLEPQLNQVIFEGKAKDIEVDYSSFVTTTDSEGDEVRVPKQIHFRLPQIKPPVD